MILRMPRFLTGALLVSALTLFAAPNPIPESARKAGEYLGINWRWENDVWGRTDQWYTNGAQMSVVFPDYRTFDETGWGLTEHLIRLGPFSETADTLYRYTLSAAQDIYTSRDLSLSNPPADDRPYAGWLRINGGLVSVNPDRMDVVEVSLGVTGDPAIAEHIQQGIHVFLGQWPEGWDTQLPFEPTLQLTWTRHWHVREQFSTDYAWDMTPMMGMTLGNIYTYAQAGLDFRIGRKLPYDFGATRIMPGGRQGIPYSDKDLRVRDQDELAAYLITGFDVRAIARNAFLDGALFSDSRSVEKEPVVADFRFGFGIAHEQFRLTFTEVFRSKEFTTQTEDWFTYGTVNLAYLF